MPRPYFSAEKGTPAPLRHTVERRIRFEEVDMLHIVWHGRYPSFFEDARLALGKKHGVGYADFRKHNSPTPIKRQHIDYIVPLSFDELITVEAIQHWSESARINIEYVIRNEAGQTTTTGYTVQMMLDMDRALLFTPPPFYQEFCRKWKSGAIA